MDYFTYKDLSEKKELSSKNDIINIKPLKWHKYNSILNEGADKHIIFNCSTNKILYIDSIIKQIVTENIDSINNIKEQYYPLYSVLLQKEFIIPSEFNETEDAISQMKYRNNILDYYELIINPTLDCNLKCWYCYESHILNSDIHPDVFDGIKSLIKGQLEKPIIQKFMLSFFGGEPLMKFDTTIWPLIKYTYNLCLEKNKKLYVSFITNAVLLTDHVINKLDSLGLCCTFQVPFDGNKKYHNKVKKDIYNQGTYEKTLLNVMHALSHGHRFIIRCNYTAQNLHSFNELISIFNKYAEECIKQKQIIFTYHKVWQTKSIKEMNYVIEEYKEKTHILDYTLDTCYADRPNSIVINYNGDIFNCTARDFRPENKEGVINNAGEIQYNEKYYNRLNIKYNNKFCQECKIFPICNVCSQVRLENNKDETICLRHASEEYKTHLLIKRMQSLI